MIAKKIVSKISPHLFNDLDKIDPEAEGLLDWCPECNEQLPDRKVLTFKRHQKIKHPSKDSDDKVARNYLIRNMIVASPLILLIGLLIGGITIIPMWSDYWDEQDGYTLENKCQQTLGEFKVSNYENKQYIQSDIDTLNWMELNCGLRISMWPNDGDEEPDPFEKTIFGSEKSYEANIKYLEKRGFR